MAARDGAAEEASLAPELEAALAARTGPDGFLPFDRFMEVALYHPRLGYYARDRSPFGAAGDFYTAPRVHPLFGRTLARRLAQLHAAVGAPDPWQLVELGAGDGTLAIGVVSSLGPALRPARLDVALVERSEARRREAVARLLPEADRAGATVRAVATVAELEPIVGAVVAHELMDAQPARRLRWDGSRWHELGFRAAAGRLAPYERPGPASVAGPPLARPEGPGTVTEISPVAEGIVREVADRLEAGALVVIDYGAEEAELLAGHRDGTLVGLRRHRVLPVPWEAPGESDLSAFVNFSRLRSAARAAGLAEVAYRRQTEALAAWGFEAELAEASAAAGSAEAEVRLRLAAKNLLFGFENFRVLELAAPSTAPALRDLSGASAAGSR